MTSPISRPSGRVYTPADMIAQNAARQQARSGYIDYLASISPPVSLADMAHIGLGSAGLLPLIGAFADGADAVLYALQRDWKGAALSGGIRHPGSWRRHRRPQTGTPGK